MSRTYEETVEQHESGQPARDAEEQAEFDRLAAYADDPDEVATEAAVDERFHPPGMAIDPEGNEYELDPGDLTWETPEREAGQ